MTGFYNRDGLCLLRGTEWVFKCNSDWIQAFVSFSGYTLLLTEGRTVQAREPCKMTAGQTPNAATKQKNAHLFTGFSKFRKGAPLEKGRRFLAAFNLFPFFLHTVCPPPLHSRSLVPVSSIYPQSPPSILPAHPSNQFNTPLFVTYLFISNSHNDSVSRLTLHSTDAQIPCVWSQGLLHFAHWRLTFVGTQCGITSPSGAHKFEAA